MTEEDERTTAKVGMTFENCSNVSIGRAVAKLHHDNLIYCASRGDLNELVEVMCKSSEINKYPYDTCIKIHEEKFLHLTRCARFRIPVGMPFAAVLMAPFKDVLYGDGSFDATTSDHASNLKRLKFSPQRETRMSFYCVEPRKEPPWVTIPADDTVKHMIVEIPDLNKCLERLF